MFTSTRAGRKQLFSVDYDGRNVRQLTRDGNNEMANVPGAPEWQLAPRAMAWQGRSSGDVCRQLIDEDRNRGRKPKDLITHMDHSLVLWGWKPGAGRERIPIEHESFVGLVAVWVHNGPECPP